MRGMIDFLIPISIAGGTILVGGFIRWLLFHKLHKWAERTKSKLDDLIIKAVRLPSLLWCVAGGLYIGVGISNLPDKMIQYIVKILNCFIILSVTVTFVTLAAGVFNLLLKERKTAVPAPGISQTLIKSIIIIMGGLILLSSLGVSITPLLTALGVGGLAVALALQDTLSNLFSGIHILADKPVRVGDYIKLDSGEEGYVTDIGWRTTKIRMLPNNIISVPNSKLAQSIITNYYFPEQELSVLVDVGVHYDSDLEFVEKVTLKVAEEVMQEVEGGVPEFTPFIRYHTFGDSSINFTVVLRAKEFLDHYRVKHEFIKRLHTKYKEVGIEIPFPIRTIYMRK
jgi:small-conductance mechanosensitive channel